MADVNDSILWLWRPPEGGYIGRRGLRPKEAPEKVTGRAIYTNDVYLPGMLYVKVYRSPHGHARIRSMDSSKAAALPGVVAVIRYDDPDIDLSDPCNHAIGTMWCWGNDSILPDTADYQGARLGAMVIAESEEICDEALRLVGEGIVWEQLPFILDAEEAASPSAPLLHPEKISQSNVWKDIVILDQGDVEKGFAESENIIEFSEYKKDDDVWAGVEPGCMVARWNGDELEFWYHGQDITMDMSGMLTPGYKNEVHRPAKLKVHAPYNGGTFGGNTVGLASHLIRYAAIAAAVTRKPAKFVDDYFMNWEGTSFETGTAHYRIGFNNDGNIKAIDIRTYQKTGLPLHSKFIDTLKTPNVRLREIRSYWNRPHESCWKDGAANCTFANLIINRVAAYLKMDPIKVQLINDGALGRDMPWLIENVKKPNGMPLRDSLKEVIEAGKKAIDWDNKWHTPGTRKLANGRMHGLGFYAVSSWHTGARKGGVPGIAMEQDGTATLFYRRADTGQSAPTTYCQVVADEIGLRYEDVRIEFIDYFYFDAVPPAGSMGSSYNTFGLVVNSRKMKKLLLESVLKRSEQSPGPHSFDHQAFSVFKGKSIDDLDIKEGYVFEKACPANRLPVKTVTRVQPQVGGPSTMGGTFFVGDPNPELPEVKEKYYMARQAVFVEVEVDTETGQVEVTRLVHPYDLGQSINPDVNENQLHGGAYAGLGVSGNEAIYYDPKTGVRLNDNHIGYPILTILDSGPIATPVVETHCGWSAYGLYGCSEAGKAAVAAALLVPAVYNAIGAWIEETPVTPDRVLKALGKA